MPIALILLAINVVFIVHAAKTGRFMPWGYVTFLLPGMLTQMRRAPSYVRKNEAEWISIAARQERA
jgi:hypothetical protein